MPLQEPAVATFNAHFLLRYCDNPSVDDSGSAECRARKQFGKKSAACRKFRRMWQAAGAPHRKWGQGTFVGKRHSDPAFGALPGLRHSSAVWTVDADVTQREKRVARVETKAKPGALCIVSKPLVFATLHPYQAICRS